MYVKGHFRGSRSDMLPPKDGRMCHSKLNGFGCTRGEGHQGNHRAGTLNYQWVAEWDDDRSTDCGSTDSEYFTEIGL